MHTEEEIKKAVKNIKGYSDDQLTHEFKIISSKTTKKEKDRYAPLFLAISKERKKRGTKTISARTDAIKVTKTELGANPSDYEDEEK